MWATMTNPFQFIFLNESHVPFPKKSHFEAMSTNDMNEDKQSIVLLFSDIGSLCYFRRVDLWWENALKITLRVSIIVIRFEVVKLQTVILRISG